MNPNQPRPEAPKGAPEGEIEGEVYYHGAKIPEVKQQPQPEEPQPSQPAPAPPPPEIQPEPGPTLGEQTVQAPRSEEQMRDEAAKIIDSDVDSVQDAVNLSRQVEELQTENSS